MKGFCVHPGQIYVIETFFRRLATSGARAYITQFPPVLLIFTVYLFWRNLLPCREKERRMYYIHPSSSSLLR